MTAQADVQTALIDLSRQCYADPLRWVTLAFPWGSGDLAAFDGPDEWQRDFLQQWGEAIQGRGFDGHTPVEAIRMCRSSGHGIGKSALVAWSILFLMSTRPHCKGTVTANTGPQLEAKTWPELAKWHRLCLWGDWFTVNAGRGSMRIVANGHEKTWRIDAQTCQKENSEAFAGQHAADSSSIYIFDEASAVPEPIWEVAEGGLTDGEPHFLAFGNPTRNSGRFYEMNFGRLRHRWNHGSVNAEQVRMTNKDMHKQWAEDWGRDSDPYRVRVLGLPPQQADLQFIPADYADLAMERDLVQDSGASLVIGVDVARFGEAQSVIRFRRGNDARSIPPMRFRGLDTMQLAGHVAAVMDEHKDCTVFIDGVGVGGGVVDRLRQLGRRVIDVNAGHRADEKGKYENKRAEMWGRMRDWLRAGGCIEKSDDLRADLVSVEYGFTDANQIKLERKEDMKRRGLASPDDADALALTFAQPVARADMKRSYGQPVQATPDFNPFQ